LTVSLQGVAKNFREIFAELVPGGKGELVMQKRLGAPAAADEDENDAEGGGRDGASEKYSGVKVKVGAPCSTSALLFEESSLLCSASNACSYDKIWQA